MNLHTIGIKIKQYRIQRKMSQERLAELSGLSTNYIGMIERGEKTPALDTFLTIANVLNVSADMLLSDVLYNGYTVKDSLLAEKLNGLIPADREIIYDVIDTLIKHSNKNI